MPLGQLLSGVRKQMEDERITADGGKCDPGRERYGRVESRAFTPGRRTEVCARGGRDASPPQRIADDNDGNNLGGVEEEAERRDVALVEVPQHVVPPARGQEEADSNLQQVRRPGHYVVPHAALSAS